MRPVGDFVISQLFVDEGQGDDGSSCQGALWELISQVLASVVENLKFPEQTNLPKNPASYLFR